MTDTPNSGKTGLPKAELPNTGLPGSAASRLRGSGPVTSAHPDANLLAAFSEQTLTAPERDEVLTHLAQCADCREVASLSLPPASAIILEPQAKEIRGWFGMRPEFMRWAIVGASASVVVAAVLLVKPELEQARVDTFATVQEGKSVDRAVAEPEVSAKAITPAEEKATGTLAKKPSADASQFKLDGADIAAPAVRRTDAPALMAKEDGPVAAAPPPLPPMVSGARAPAAGQGIGAGQGAGVGSATGNLASQTQTVEVTSARPAQTLAMKPSANQPATLGNEVRLADADSRMVNDSAVPKKAKSEVVRERQAATIKDEGKVAAAPSLAKREPSADAVEVQGEAAFAVQGAVSARNMKTMNRFRMEPRTWRVQLGRLQSSQDGGMSWQNPVLPPGVQPLTVDAAQPFAVWVGGAAGVLLTSSDNGATWERISGGWSGDVVYIKFTDAKNGALRTSTKEEWFTEDGGAIWKKR